MYGFKFNYKHFRKLIYKSSAFTLVELLIVISIISILSLIGILNLLNYNRSQAVNQAAQNFMNVLSIAKSNTQTQLTTFIQSDGTPINCDDATEYFWGYKVEIISSGHYALEMACHSKSSATIRNIPVKDYLTNLVSISSGTPPFYISYIILTGEIFAGGGNPDASFNRFVQFNYGSNTKIVKVDKLGKFSLN
jgi:prepilin-type N-terminal cleavage/methylation domain-containing protein